MAQSLAGPHSLDLGMVVAAGFVAVADTVVVVVDRRTAADRRRRQPAARLDTQRRRVVARTKEAERKLARRPNLRWRTR